MEKRAELFLHMSALLTGFGRVALLGTGMADGYMRALDSVLPAGMLDELPTSYSRLCTGKRGDTAVPSEILGDAKLGPVARNLILLWYCGTWTALPDA